MLEPAVMLAKRRRVMLTVSKGASPDQGSRDLSDHLTTSSAQSAVSADQAASSDEGPPDFSSASRGASPLRSESTPDHAPLERIIRRSGGPVQGPLDLTVSKPSSPVPVDFSVFKAVSSGQGPVSLPAKQPSMSPLMQKTAGRPASPGTLDLRVRQQASPTGANGSTGLVLCDEVKRRRKLMALRSPYR